MPQRKNRAPYTSGSAGARKYAKPIYRRKLVEAQEDTGLPVVRTLTTARTLRFCKSSIDDGFTSVMIDGSKYPFEENIEITKSGGLCPFQGCGGGSRAGKLAGIEDNVSVSEREATFTDPDQAVEFVERTGIDSLP